MQLIWHDHIQSFLAETQSFLEQQEARNSLMLGVALRLLQAPELCLEVRLGTLRDSKGLVLAGLRTPPEKLILAGRSAVPSAAWEYLVQVLLEKDRFLPGVLGPQELAKDLAALWTERRGCTAKLDMATWVYELRDVNPQVIGEGRLRPAQQADLDFLTQAIREFQQDAGVEASPDQEACAQLARRFLANGAFFLWEHDGQVVSMAAKVRPTRRGGSINLVYTPRELRGRGYATSCVAALCRELLASGYQLCCLFADAANPISNRVYQKIGFRPVCQFHEYTFKYD